MLNDGMGGFAAPVRIVPGGRLGGVAIGDLNGDDKADIVVAVQSVSGSVQLLLNKDGKPDLITTQIDSPASTLRVGIALNQGNLQFFVNVFYTIHSILGQSGDILGLVVGDINGDGKPDLVFTSSGAESAVVMLNMGSGTFAPDTDYFIGRARFVTLGQGRIALAALADLDGDGKLDVVVTNHSPVRVLFNHGCD